MASTLGTFLYVALLLVNAIAILNEERFLARGKFPVQSQLSDNKSSPVRPSRSGLVDVAAQPEGI